MTSAVTRLFAWLAGTALALGAPPVMATAANSSWSVRVWQTEDGLPNSTVTAIGQTSDGFLWIATRLALARFDGFQFEEFRSTHFFGEAHTGVETMLLMRDGRLCVALDSRQVLSLRKGSAHVLEHAEAPPQKFARNLVEDAAGRLWIAYASGEIRREEGGRLVQVMEGGKPAAPVDWLASDRQGRLWFARGNELGLWRNERFEVLLSQFNAPTRLTAARDGGIWIYSGSRLFNYDEGRELREYPVQGPVRPTVTINTMLEDSGGSLWIGTSRNGLFRYDGSHFENVPVSDRQVQTVYEDSWGNLWAGTGGGLNLIRPRAVEFQVVDTGLPFEALESLCEDKHGTLWGATRNGLFVWETSSGWSTNLDVHWPAGEASVVAADQDGGIWIGTRNRELRRWADGRFTVWRQSDGLTSRSIRALLVSSRGDLWIGGQGPYTLQCLRDGKFINFQLPEDIDNISALTEDLEGNIWLGAGRGILLRISNDQVINETHRTVPPAKSIRDLHVTADGSLWIAYAGGGVGRLKNGRFTRFLAEQGLPNITISRIVADDRGWLWFGGDRGIFSIRQQSLIDVAEGRLAHVRALRHRQSEGLPHTPAIYGHSPGGLRSRDGRIWIPMRTGVAVVNPSRLRPQNESPRALIQRVAINEEIIGQYGGEASVPGLLDLENTRTIRVPPNHRNLEIKFTAPNFAAPENVQFRYRLLGFVDNWAGPGAARSVSYSRLRAGKYQFQVQTSHGDDLWSEPGASLAIVVAPFFWQTWWFQLGALGLFTSALVGLVRYVSFRRLRNRLQDLQQQAALDKERARIARDIHDDLGSRLTQITMLSGITLQNPSRPEQVAENVRQISSVAYQGIQSLDETVWAVNPRNDTLSHLVDYLGQFSAQFLHAVGIKYELDLPRHLPQRAIFAEVRHNLFLAVKETLNNVARHAAASRVELRVIVDETAINISIQDNGRGFAGVPDNAGADGLRNLRRRMEEIGGTCEITSQPGAGTRVVLNYFWPPAR